MKTPTNLREIRELYGIHQEVLGSARVEAGMFMPGMTLRARFLLILKGAGAEITMPELLDLCQAHQPQGKEAIEGDAETGPHPAIAAPTEGQS